MAATPKKGAACLIVQGSGPCSSRVHGRSRGGLTTKIHALVDTNGLPVAIKLTEGQAHDGRSAADMLDAVQAGQVLLADRAYDSNALPEG